MKTKLLTAACVLAIGLAGLSPCRASETPAPAEPVETHGPAPVGESPDPANVVLDFVLARPACLVVTAVGTAFFLVSLPVAAISKSVPQTCDALVVKPGKATFTRPLGDLDALLD